jgi:hypothetical protein
MQQCLVANRSGVIMTVTSIPARTGTLLQGGYPPAMAAKEALTRDLSAELAPRAFVWSGCDHTGSGNRHAQGSLPASCHGMGNDLGTVAGVAGEQDPPATAFDARGAG